MELQAGPGRRIGLLGGSFNPAHDGHRHISRVALRRLGLDQVWWLVSPQNPLKPVAGMAPLATRLAQARSVARHPRIAVTDIERRLGTRYTVDTLRALRTRWPGTRFVWLMGADNLASFARWRRWTEIAAMVPIAVINRPGYARPGLAGLFAHRYAARRLPDAMVRALPDARPPAWVLLRARLHGASSTAIRLAAAHAAAPNAGGTPNAGRSLSVGEACR